MSRSWELASCLALSSFFLPSPSSESEAQLLQPFLVGMGSALWGMGSFNHLGLLTSPAWGCVRDKPSGLNVALG